MSVKNMVQVGSTMWLDPANIVGVRWIEATEPLISKHSSEMIMEGHPGYTQVIHRDDTGFMPHTGFLSSDWHIARVQSALGLVSADDLDGML